MAPRAVIALFLVVGCGGAIPFREDFASDLDYREYMPALEVLAECPGKKFRYGSGVAIGSATGITANHVVTCDEGLPLRVQVDYNGKKMDVKVSARDVHGDVARLDALAIRPFPIYARFSSDPRPLRMGAQVCVVTGRYLKKCGRVAIRDANLTSIVVRAVPGNSGSPVYDAEGDLRGIVITGTAGPGVEEVAVFSNAIAWKLP